MRTTTITGSGIRQPLPHSSVLGQRMAAADRPGEHLWVMAGMWHLSDPERLQGALDAENMLEIAGPGCFKCEREYSRKLARRRCTETAP